MASRTLVTLSYTYDKVTPESAEDGSTSENGWLLHGREYPLSSAMMAQDESVLAQARNGAFDLEMRASEAVRSIQSTLGCFESELHADTLTLYQSDSDTNYWTGEGKRVSTRVKGDPRLLAAMLRRLGAK